MRIICACKELEIRTVAVYSEADRDSLHVRFADEAVCIGPPRSSESYLNMAGIISAAEVTGVDAIHPGYGFFSENPQFAEVCEASKITFIGPRSDVIRLMGDKNRARKVMREAGVPVLPGTGIIGSEKEALEFAGKVGYPVIVKASAGGGGRGMRVVGSAGEFSSALQNAQSEASAAFGCADVYLEKYLDNPRHIEFQVLGDHHGKVIHLGERECSIQRRHQKIMEESPSPSLTEQTRRRTGATVVKALTKLGYTNSGTVEFLMDRSGKLFFIEMNTRLQVEHTVTEMCTGFDLVAAQIQIAEGAPLPWCQPDITLHGAAIECRIYAEDPAKNFVPSPGRITALQWPSGQGIRVDSGVRQGSQVTPYYDPLLAKVIAHGATRAQAIDRMRHALAGLVLKGVSSNIIMHQQILDHTRFQAGDLDTDLVLRTL